MGDPRRRGVVMRRRAVSALVVAGGVVASSLAAADSHFDSVLGEFAGLSGGVGLSTTWGASKGVRPSGEVTVSWLGALLVSNLSAGATFRGASPEYVYGELALRSPRFPYLAMGGGAGRFADERSQVVVAAHGFVGVSVPIGPIRGYPPHFVPFIQPYYRPQFAFEGVGTAHEIGLQLKLLVTWLDND